MPAATEGFLTTHVLDTMSGQPAAGMKLELFAIDGDTRKLITVRTTNHDGRCDSPILRPDEFSTGEFELVFQVGDYFRNRNVELSDPPFLNVVPIRFGISDLSSHYHVPLLVSPYSFSTYRGS